jgi:hypothetical protein
MPVSEEEFRASVHIAQDAGFRVISEPEVPLSRAVLLGKVTVREECIFEESFWEMNTGCIR